MGSPTRRATPRPPLGWAQLAGAKVGLWGLRTEGAANLRRLRQTGVVPVLVDDHPVAPTFGGLRVLDGAGGGLEALSRCEVVIKSPGISRYSADAVALVDAGVLLTGGLGLWLEDADRDHVACITGTKGKSTTTAIAGHLLARLGYRCLVAGNIGVPPWDPSAGDAWDWWVVETSSYQATDVASSPPVVAVTSLGPDHLDWHGSVDAYYADKLSLCTQPGARLTIADASCAALRARVDQLGPEVRWVAEGDPELDGPWVEGLGLCGAHYRRDALIARACMIGLGVVEAGDANLLAQAAQGFVALKHRFRSLGSIEGVEFIDDGLSTNVLPTLAALDALSDRPVALLVGGQDRGIDYSALGLALARRREPTFVATLPASGRRIRESIDAAVSLSSGEGGGRAILDVVDCTDVRAATVAGFEWARPLGGVVVLSPAAPSFGQFRDYRERSAAFAQAMRGCAAPASGTIR